MRNLLKPSWLFAINTFPLCLLVLMFWGNYTLISTLLSEEELALWTMFGTSWIVIGVIHLLITGLLVLSRKELNLVYGLITLMIYLPLVYFTMARIDRLLPWSLPNWLNANDLMWLPISLAMPTLLHALIVVVMSVTKNPRQSPLWYNIAGVAAIPLIVYLLFNIGILSGSRDGHFWQSFFPMLFVCGTITFFFFLCRTVYILMHKKSWGKYGLIWKIPVLLVFPLLGLAINNGLLLERFDAHFFGRFDHPLYYIIAAINGLVILLYPYAGRRFAFPVFLLTCAGFPFSLYFTLVFLPFLPFSIFAVALAGFGFLLLTPLLVFFQHIQALSLHYSRLREQYRTMVVATAGLLAFMLLPAAITVSYLLDRSAINSALSYVYKPDYQHPEPKPGRDRVNRVLQFAEMQQRNSRGFLFEGSTPYLSAYYRWLVLDNMMLGQQKIEVIRAVFNGKTQEADEVRTNFPQPENTIAISNLTTKSSWHPEGYYTTWIDLELLNNSTRPNAEYRTAFNLPDGAFISNYYLYIGRVKEMGILAEKKSALWIFNQIVNVNRDPGILHYDGGQRVVFRVFPFAGNERRLTGIELTHKDPVKLMFDGRDVLLGDSVRSTHGVISAGGVTYIPAEVKRSLPRVQRKPYYHFVVDASHKGIKLSTYQAQLEALKQFEPVAFQGARITIAGEGFETGPYSDSSMAHVVLPREPTGFFPDRAMRQAMYNEIQRPGRGYPVFVVLSSKPRNAIILDDFADLAQAYPEMPWYFELNGGNMVRRSLLAPGEEVKDTTALNYQTTVLAWPDARHPRAYLPDNDAASVAYTTDTPSQAEAGANRWVKALVQQGNWMRLVMHPEETDKRWLSLVRESFRNHMMSPVTSFLVVENEAQKIALQRKQQQVLNGNPALDVEETQNMSEPHFWMLLILLGAVVLLKRKTG